jgi:ribosomal protein S18 acetylase RimI-like enzyme
MRLLERPVWSSLTTHHAAMSEGGGLARRFARDVNLFASARDDSPEAVEALASLVKAGETIFILQVSEIVIPPGLVEVKAAKGVQMVAPRGMTFEPARGDILTLTKEDAPEMGTFIGIRVGGRLVAMAGERMRFPGYTEVSGVCTHPEFRGRGLARRLSTAVVSGIEARGDQAFLHAWKSNHSAIALYESLGFQIRAEVNVAVLQRGPAI